MQELPALPDRLLLLALTLGALALAVVRAGRLTTLTAAAVLSFAAAGLVAHAGLESRWPAAAGSRDIRLSGWIDSVPAEADGRTVFSLRIVAAGSPVPLRRVRLSWYAPAPALRAGQALDLEARLRAPRGLVNPGGFDYERWLFVEAYDATGYVRSGRVEPFVDYGIAQRWSAFRAALLERIGWAVGNETARALIAALGLGERGGFDDADWAVLQRTGTSHLVAVSGLHVGLIAALSFLALRWLLLRQAYHLARHAERIAAALCILPAALYAALAGFALPTRRALLMLLVAQWLVACGRRWPAGTGLGFALIVVVLCDPLATLSASFWMSFGAVALLLATAAAVVRPVGGARLPLVERLRSFWHVQWILTLGLAPLVIGFFGQVSAASLVVNLVAIPLFSLIVVPLSLLCLLALAVGAGSSWIVALAAGVAALAWQGLELAAALRFAAFELAPPPRFALVLGLIAVTAALPLHRLPGRRLALLGVLPLALGPATGVVPGEARLTVLDVGHGLAAVIETATHRVLYDAGPLSRSGFDAGAEIVAPVIAALGPEDPDLLVLSHGDSDHAGGARALVSRYPAIEVLAGPDVGELADGSCRRGQRWEFDEVRFSVLHPPPSFAPRGNESSCVLRVDTQHGSLLLTGDIESRAESLLARDAALAADVVVVPHHGSLTSSSERFVEAVRARIAIVSAGYENRWGFPRPEVRERWSQRGATVLVTGELGAIGVGFTADGLAVDAWRYRRHRYWNAEPAPLSGAIGR